MSTSSAVFFWVSWFDEDGCRQTGASAASRKKKKETDRLVGKQRQSGTSVGGGECQTTE